MDNLTYYLRKDGDAERPGVMWAWGDRINPEDIVYQIHKFKESGIEEFYIHPGWMSEFDDYLSDFYMDMVTLACETAESLGMKYSIYDEYDWASGSCAGKVFAKYPEYRMHILKWFRFDAQAGQGVKITFEGKLLAVQVKYADKQGKREDITDKVRVETFGEDGGRVYWQNNNCCATHVFVFCDCLADCLSPTSQWAPFVDMQPGFTDTMNKDAVKKFFEMNNEVYKKRLGDRFGKTIRRIFTDETSLAPFIIPNIRPYSPVADEEFYNEHGYKISDNYIALTDTFETDWDIKVRHDYYKTCTRLFTTAYLQQYSDWCHENNLLLTGHMSGGGLPFYHTTQMGDFWEALSKFDIPGLDTILSKKYVNNIEFGYATKMVASVAKFNGKDKIMCETFSGSGWDLSLEDAKHIMNKLMAYGITYIIYMTAFFSMNEGRKNFPVGYPPSHGFNNPLFKHYGTLTDYAAVRSSVLTQTKPCGSALLFLPQIESWSNIEASRNRTRYNTIWRESNVALQKRNVEYDVYFEPLASEVTVKDGKITLKGYTYDTLIVPSARCTNKENMDIIAEFAKQGGRLVFIEKIPYLAADTSERYDIASACGLAKEGINFFKQNTALYKTYIQDNIMLINMGAEQNEIFDARYTFWDDLSNFVRAGSAEEKIELEDALPGISITRRSAKGLYCGFVFNDTNENKTVKLRINSTDKLTLLDGVNLLDLKADNGYVTLNIAPHDMPVVLITEPGVSLDGISGKESEHTPAGAESKIVLDKGWTVKTGDNLLPLKIRYLTKAEPCGKLSPEIAKMAETAEVPYAIQEFPAGEGIKYGDGYAAFARFEIKDMPKSLELFTEIVDDAELWLNGKLLSGYKKVFERGPKDKVTDITDYVKTGTNVLIMFHHVPTYKAPHQMPTSIVRGQFCLDESCAIVKNDENIDVTKYYTEQGRRYYSGDLTYKNTFNLDYDNPKKITVNVETKEVAEIIVNGVSAGIYCWQPYEADITALCKKGENSIEIVFTTTSGPTMVLEEIVLLYQGVSEYRDEVAPQAVGTNTAPVITVIV